MGTKKISIILLCLFSISQTAIAQEVLIESNYTIRDFIVQNDTLIISNESYVELYKNNILLNRYYAGGHIIKLDYYANNQIITAANKYKKNIGSIRIFDFKKNKLQRVYSFTDNSPLLDYRFLNKNKIIVSFNNGEVNVYDRKPLTIEYQLWNTSKVRDIKISNNNIIFCTDMGDLISVEKSKIDTLLSFSDKRLISLISTQNAIFAISNKGQLFKLNKGKVTSIKLSDSILTDIIAINKNTLAISSWDGKISFVDIKTFTVIKSFKAHTKQILKLKLYNGVLYSSSADKTLKTWTFN